jgi:hypothetical protein
MWLDTCGGAGPGWLGRRAIKQDVTCQALRLVWALTKCAWSPLAMGYGVRPGFRVGFITAGVGRYMSEGERV